MDMVAYALPVVDDVPSTYPKVILSSESGNWTGAMEEEMQSLKKNKTWKLAQLPKGKKAIGCKWVFAKKEEFSNKEDVGYKTRLVAKGFAQREGIDYNEVFSPATDEEREYMSKVSYANADGSMMYAMVCTRPDISQAVSVVSKYMHDPGQGHWQAVRWILRYLQNTLDVGLTFEQDEPLGQCIVGYCDSDYASDLNKRRSTTGYLFTLAKAPVS